MTFVRRQCLTIARMALSAWVGAAVLFVVNGVRLVTADAFGSVERDHMSLLRFPPYYLLGFVLVGTALVCLCLARGYPRKLAIGLVVAALAVMLADYFAVYRPLEAMITPPGQPRTAQFLTYHRASRYINAVHVGLCLIAAVIVCRPLTVTDSDSP